MRTSASPTAITRRSGAQSTGARPKGPIGMALTPARVATRRQERFAERMTGEALLEEDPAQIGMIVELDTEHVVGLALAPVRGRPYAGERGDVWIELRAGRAEHHEDLRRRAAHEGDRAQLCSGVDARVDRVEIAAGARIIANEPSDLDQRRTVDVDHEHVVKDRDARLIAELRRDEPGESQQAGHEERSYGEEGEHIEIGGAVVGHQNLAY